jgi:hypothetical protein
MLAGGGIRRDHGGLVALLPLAVAEGDGAVRGCGGTSMGVGGGAPPLVMDGNGR